MSESAPARVDAIKKQLFLHVGTHKTGTTSFQSVLVENRRSLSDQGWHVHLRQEMRWREKPHANCIDIAHAGLRNSLRTAERQLVGNSSFDSGPAAALAAKKRIAKGVALSGCQKIILSTEMLCLARTGDETRMFREIFQGYEIVPIIVFRDTENWQKSYRHQHTNNRWKKYPELDNSTLVGNWYFDKAAITRFWTQFGTPRIMDYDLVTLDHGSALPALVREIGLPIPASKLAVFLNTRK